MRSYVFSAVPFTKKGFVKACGETEQAMRQVTRIDMYDQSFMITSIVEYNHIHASKASSTYR